MDYRRAYETYLVSRDKFPGMTPAQAVAQIMRAGEMAVPQAAPQGAIAAVQPPVTAPQPQVPAVMQQALAAGTPEVAVEQAPEEQAAEEDFVTPAEAALSAFNIANPIREQAPAAKGAKIDYAARAKQEAIDAQREALKARVDAEAAAQVDPRLQKVLDERVERTTAELEGVDKERQQAIWMAIAQAGMKMAQSQSPYFMQALASGMEAGLGGYSEAKAKAAEKKARLQETKEDLTLKTIELQNQARKDAVAGMESSIQTAAARQGLQGGALKNLLAGETIDEEIAAAGLRNVLTQEQIANARQSRALAAAAGARAERAARSGGGSGAGVKLSQLNPIVNGAISENDRLREMLNNPLASSRLSKADKAAIGAKISENDKIIAYGRSLQKQKLGMGSEFKIVD